MRNVSRIHRTFIARNWQIGLPIRCRRFQGFHRWSMQDFSMHVKP
jgi:hypothetical protein